MQDSQTATKKSARPIPLHKALEDEYICLHGPLPEEYPWLFLPRHLKNATCLINRIGRAEDTVSKFLLPFLRAQFSWRKWHTFDFQAVCGKAVMCEIRPALLKVLNEQLKSAELYDEQRFASVSISDATRRLVMAARSTGNDLCYANRMLLEEAYPEELAKIFGDEAAHTPPCVRQNCVAVNERGQTDTSEIAKLANIRLEALYSLIHQRNTKRSALCLSGGGIRSATFNLGALQGLARYGLLEKFDYLSTVSGGGYIGSWLSAWIHRHTKGFAGVAEELSQTPQTPLEPDPKPIEHLRNYSNHLSPQTGLLSADFWTMVAVYLRNLFLNWLVFIPLFMTALMIPRIIAALIIPHTLGIGAQPGGARWIHILSIIIGFASAAVAIFYIGVNLPSSGKPSNSRRSYLLFCLIPLVVSAASFVIAWPQYLSYTQQPFEHKFTFARSTLLIYTLAGGIFGLAVYVTARFFRHYNPRAYTRRKAFSYFVLAALTTAFAASVSGLLIYETPRFNFIDPTPIINFDLDSHLLVYVCLAVPLLLMLYALAATIVAGVTSRWTNDDDHEWWARSGAWILILILMWIVVCPLVLYGPQLLVDLLTAIQLDVKEKHFWTAAAKALPVILGIISGFITILGGKSLQTHGSNGSAVIKPKSAVLHTLSKLAAPAFFAFLVIVLALATDGLFAVFLAVWKWYGTSYLHSWLHPIFNALHLSLLTSWIGGGLSAAESLRANSMHLAFTNTPSLPGVLAFTATLGALGWLMGVIIDTNKFSLHAFYGNRLKRAYLGASRSDRAGNLFTGFDAGDDLQINQLRPALLRAHSFTQLSRFILNLNSSRDYFTVRLRSRLSADTKRLLDDYSPPACPDKQLEAGLIKDLNDLLEDECLYVEGHFPCQRLSKRTARLLRQNPQGESLVLLNRWLLDEAYPEDIKKYQRPPLLHIVNIALNLARGEKLAWQERKAETFTVSPLHSGNYLQGYRRSKEYGDPCGGISLGTAFTISGAAASPNMGYMISSPLVSFLMAMFNVRLGWWLGNPGEAGRGTFRRAVPKFAFGPVVKEALSLADDKSKYVYLSDGGHFENLGLYEMVLRRCHCILICDASTDTGYTYESLGMAIRKIRIDFGVPIDFHEFDIYTNSPEIAVKNERGRYCAVGTIRYSCVDGEGTDGHLIYLKPSLSGDEPRDIANYRHVHDEFPQDFIGDQFFDESQFESYRMLGSHIIKTLCGEDTNQLSLNEFRQRAQGNISPQLAAGKAELRAEFSAVKRIFSGAWIIDWFNK